MWSRIAVVAATASVAAAAPANAAEPERPKPPACSGSVLSDQRGDVLNEGLDLVSAFLSVRDGKVHVNLLVARLDGEVDEPEATEEYFRVDYTDARGRPQHAHARLHNGGERVGATWFDGRDGIVQIRLPRLTPGTPTTLSAAAGGSQGSQHVAVSQEVYKQRVVFDFGVDISGDDVDRIEAQKTVLCPPKPLPVAPVGSPQKSHGTPGVAVGTPRVRGRTMRVPLRSRSRVRDVRGRLARDGRVVARGRLAELEGRGTLVLTARRALRPGSYVLTIPGVVEQRLRIG